MKTIVEKIEEIITPVLAAENVELVDLQLKGRSGAQVVKIFIDSDGGVTLDKCTEISRLLSVQFDVEEVIQDKYRLEVSSPGVNRPLQTSKDFRRNIHREVEILFVAGTDHRSVRGEIVEVLDDTVALRNKEGLHEIQVSAIKQGKLVLPW